MVTKALGLLLLVVFAASVFAEQATRTRPATAADT